MDDLKYQNIIESVLQEYVEYIGNSEPEVQKEQVFDREGKHFLLVETGWQNNRRIYGAIIHIDIINGKVWIQQDGTEEGIAYDLVKAGIPKEHIVLGFKALPRRETTEFAVS
jgi:XisI protein